MKPIKLISKKAIFTSMIFFALIGFGHQIHANENQTKSIENKNLTNDISHRRDKHKKRPYRVYPMSEAHFNQFLSIIRKSSFSDCQLNIIETGCINNYFTCRQVLSVIKLFNFDNEKINVVKKMSQNIIDTENRELLVEHFTFLSSKEEVRKLLHR